MTDNLFEGGDNKPQVDENKDYLVELVGEGKKFKDNQALARGKYEADQTVEMMKSRLDELRADYQKLHEDRQQGASLQELKDLIQSQKQSDGNLTPKADDLNVPQIKAEDIEKLVQDQIEKRENVRKEQDNLSFVQQKLKERYGNNYQNFLSEQRDALQLTDAEVNSLARKSPEAFFRVMGFTDNVRETFQSPTRSSMRSDTFSPTTNKRTWAYYQDLKKKDRNLYYSPKIFNQMLKDAEDLGDAFKDGDYKAFGD